MKARINPQKSKVERLAEWYMNNYYEEETGKLKNETEFFQLLYECLGFINQNREKDGGNEFVVFAKTENGEYYFDDEIVKDKEKCILDDNDKLANFGLLMFLSMAVMVGDITEDEYVSFLEK